MTSMGRSGPCESPFATAAAVGLCLGLLAAGAVVVVLPALLAAYVVAGWVRPGTGWGRGALAVGLWFAAVATTALSYAALQSRALGEATARRDRPGPGAPPNDPA